MQAFRVWCTRRARVLLPDHQARREVHELRRRGMRGTESMAGLPTDKAGGPILALHAQPCLELTEMYECLPASS